jgi:malate dehydrogenase (oxaloacetate-decarboxylating)(NADP+)
MLKQKITKKGMELLRDSHLNKSTAFTAEEREALGLIGLVPDVCESQELQVRRVLQQLGHKETDLARYIYLMGLLDHNETLFYKVIMSDPTRFLPIIYDPTIGEACLKYDHIIRSPRGIYLSIEHKGRVKEILSNWPEEDIRFICVTNGGRILGLGDLGANGTPIPIGKLQLYTAAAGVPPQHLLPVFLDSGTNNEALLHDPFYLGIRRTRPKTAELDVFVDEFVEAVQELFPLCCIHFEDWSGVDAVHLLARYRDKVCCYNDDVQGTAGIVLAGILNAVAVKEERLSDQRFLFLGAGSAGIGIANLLVSAMEAEGVSREQARSQVCLFDVNGLLESSRRDLVDFQRAYAHNLPPCKEFLEAVMRLKPTAIIGVSTIGGAFTQEVVEAMSHLNHRPILFALSNPTDHAECTAEQAYNWSDGEALYAAGVQFNPVTFKGKTILPGQANNFYIFPALGLAVFATQAERVTDEMFIEAAKAVSGLVTSEQLNQGLLFPLQSDIREAEVKTAIAVANSIFDAGFARVERPADVDAFIRSHLYSADY